MQAAKEWLRPEKGLSPGLQRLARENRIDLSMEALVQQEPWKQLFSEGELSEAKRRIAAVEKLSGF